MCIYALHICMYAYEMDPSRLYSIVGLGQVWATRRSPRCKKRLMKCKCLRSSLGWGFSHTITHSHTHTHTASFCVICVCKCVWVCECVWFCLPVSGAQQPKNLGKKWTAWCRKSVREPTKMEINSLIFLSWLLPFV